MYGCDAGGGTAAVPSPFIASAARPAQRPARPLLVLPVSSSSPPAHPVPACRGSLSPSTPSTTQSSFWASFYSAPPHPLHPRFPSVSCPAARSPPVPRRPRSASSPWRAAPARMEKAAGQSGGGAAQQRCGSPPFSPPRSPRTFRGRNPPLAARSPQRSASIGPAPPPLTEHRACGDTAAGRGRCCGCAVLLRARARQVLQRRAVRGRRPQTGRVRGSSAGHPVLHGHGVGMGGLHHPSQLRCPSWRKVPATCFVCSQTGRWSSVICRPALSPARPRACSAAGLGTWRAGAGKWRWGCRRFTQLSAAAGIGAAKAVRRRSKLRSPVRNVWFCPRVLQRCGTDELPAVLLWNAARRAARWGWEHIPRRGSECSLHRKVFIRSFFNSVFSDRQMRNKEKFSDIQSCRCAQQVWGPRNVGSVKVESKRQELVTVSGTLDVIAVV